MRIILSAALPILLVVLGGCARDVIPNTDVEDTPDNREVVQFVEGYRRAVERRNVGRMLALASARYFDDNGTPSGDDDLDYERLREKLIRWQETVEDIRYEIRYRRVTYARDRVLVDYTYSGSFRLARPEGDRWARRRADNRLVLAREGDSFRIVSGM